MIKNTLQRIKEYIDFKGISIHAFEQKIGMSNGSFASQLKNNKTIGVDKLENILNTYKDISPEWLLTGKEPMLKEQVTLQQSAAADNTINIYVDKITQQAEQIGELKNENKNLCKEISALQNDLECREKEITELRDENSELRGIISSQFDSPEDMPELPGILAQLVAESAGKKRRNVLK
jgi:transcriptional regulator with XRE-family HTH domain